MTGFGRQIEILGRQIVVNSFYGVFIIENLVDCKDNVGGRARLNSCEICYGGTTDLDSLESEQACIESIGAASYNRGIQLHANPVADQLMASLPIKSSGFIVDFFGNKVIKEIRSGANNVSNLKTGVYFLIVTTEDIKEVVKVIKQ